LLKLTGPVFLSFPINNKTVISSLTNGTSVLHLDVSDSYFNTSKRLIFPIIANISFAPTITKKGDNTYNNTQTIFLSETADLEVNIERSLTDFEKAEKYISSLKPIGEACIYFIQ
jgi:endoglucanase Acf2